MKSRVADTNERDEAPTFTQAHLEYLERTFPVTIDLDALVTSLDGAVSLAVKHGAVCGQQSIIAHIRSLLRT